MHPPASAGFLWTNVCPLCVCRDRAGRLETWRFTACICAVLAGPPTRPGRRARICATSPAPRPAPTCWPDGCRPSATPRGDGWIGRNGGTARMPA
ncbi:hypothetical protein E4P82_20785 [Candidatus Competibacter phosphatis]|uniref:Uncharacterized protein n=1 Tax=Candidatus Competibacter phosphatis TaxID=221280 RepID=A0ABX1TTY8_9GAMM|nr:hypothetical protein [Candidatus Competibacter phosphatis]